MLQICIASLVVIIDVQYLYTHRTIAASPMKTSQ